MQLLNLQTRNKSQIANVPRLLKNPQIAEKHMCTASEDIRTKHLKQNIFSKSSNFKKEKQCIVLLKRFTRKMKIYSKTSRKENIPVLTISLPRNEVTSEQIMSNRVIKKDNRRNVLKAHNGQQVPQDKNVNCPTLNIRDLKVLIPPLSPHNMKTRIPEVPVSLTGEKDLKVIVTPVSHDQLKLVDKVQTIEDRHNRRSTPLINRLRHKEKKNYLELSGNTTINEASEKQIEENGFSKHKVPIYKRAIIDNQNIKKVDDPYELDISSDPDKPQKRKRKKIHKKNKVTNIKLKYVKKNKSDKISNKNYATNIQEVLTRIIKNKNIHILNKKDTRREPLANNIDENIDNIIFKQPSANEKINQPLDIQNENNYTAVLNEYDIGVLSKKQNSLPLDKYENDRSSPDRFENNCPSPNIFQNNCSSPDIFQNVTNDKYFGFEEEEVQTRPPINVIGNVLLNDLSVCEISEKNNCTVVSQNNLPTKSVSKENTIADIDKKPWRSPALHNQQDSLIYKKNSMPCLEQESVLDYQLEVRCLRNRRTCASEIEKCKSSRQTSLLDYVETSKEIDLQQENNQENCFSLFNYEEFIIRPSRRNIVVRKVLGLIQENNQIESTPIKNIRNDVCPDISAIASTSYSNPEEVATPINNDMNSTNHTYFGFESGRIDETPVVSNKAGPFRMDTDDIKRYKQYVRKDIVAKKLSDELPSVLQDLRSEPDTNDNNVKFFDDVEPELLVSINEGFTYSKKRKPRKRLLSCIDNTEEEKTKKRKKNEMTKAEKEDFEKQASQLNAMFEEIEKHELLID